MTTKTMTTKTMNSNMQAPNIGDHKGFLNLECIREKSLDKQIRFTQRKLYDLIDTVEALELRLEALENKTL